MVPSKAYYYMAAGLALVIISDRENDLTDMVETHQCGVWIKSRDIEGLASAIVGLHEKPAMLLKYKQAAREVAVRYYSRQNSRFIADIVSAVVMKCQHET